MGRTLFVVSGKFFTVFSLNTATTIKLVLLKLGGTQATIRR